MHARERGLSFSVEILYRPEADMPWGDTLILSRMHNLDKAANPYIIPSFLVHTVQHTVVYLFMHVHKGV